jgi:hypothetical protein
MHLSRRALLAFVCVIALGLPSAAMAQEDELRFYVVPSERLTPTGPLFPKYFGAAWAPTLGDAVLIYQAIQYGPEHRLVASVLPQSAHDFIASQNDAFAIGPLDEAIGGNPTLNRVRNSLEALGIPGTWITASTTWREVVRRTGTTAQIIGRMRGALGRRIFDNGVGLNTTLSESLRDELVIVAASLATLQQITIDTSGVTTQINVRTALLLIGDQLKPFMLAGEVF